MIVVSDASPLIALGAVQALDLLRAMYGCVLIPDAVHREVSADLSRAGATDVLSAEWIEVRQVANLELVASLAAKLGRGEAEAIALTLEAAADLLILDDRQARRAAENLGLAISGVGGVMVEAKRLGHIAAVKPMLDQMTAAVGFRISPALRALILRAAGEG